MKVDFFIVGAPKAGTTSLYYYFNEHPEIKMSAKKEPDFFSDKAIQQQRMYYSEQRIDTLEKYEALFPDDSAHKKLGEASVSYLFYPNVAKDIYKYNPNAKIIIMLRNPVDRAFSHYLMDYRLGLVSDSFDYIIDKQSSNPKDKLFYQQYIEVSAYAQQIKRYFEVFDITNILVIEYEEFKKDTQGIVKKGYAFLEVDDSFVADVDKKHNTYTMPYNEVIRKVYSMMFLRKILNILLPKILVKKIRKLFFRIDKKPTLSEHTRTHLKALFKNDIEELSNILSTDFSRWIK